MERQTFLVRVFGSIVQRIKRQDRADDNDRRIGPLKDHISVSSEFLEAKYKYYDYARAEIAREDNIAFQRLTITLTFQGFLLAMLGLIAAAEKWLGEDGEASISRYLVLILISATGLVFSIFSFHGIHASRRSLQFAKDQWVNFNRLNGYIYPSLVPQLSKRSNLHSGDKYERHEISGILKNSEQGQFPRDPDRVTDDGGDFAIVVPVLLSMLWICLTILWFALLFQATFPCGTGLKDLQRTGGLSELWAQGGTYQVPKKNGDVCPK